MGRFGGVVIVGAVFREGQGGGLSRSIILRTGVYIYIYTYIYIYIYMAYSVLCVLVAFLNRVGFNGLPHAKVAWSLKKAKGSIWRPLNPIVPPY